MEKKVYPIVFLIICVAVVLIAVLFMFIFAHNAQSSNTVIISEVIPANRTLFADEYDNYYDIVELYNGSDEPVDITGYGLSDNLGNPQ